MSFDDLATKEDLKKLEDKIASLLSSAKITTEDIPKGMKMTDVQEAFGGVSRQFVDNLRIAGVLSATKLGDLWIFNRQQVIDHIPKYINK